MPYKSNRFLNLALATLGCGITAMQVNAQEATFRLPVKAHVGSAILEPGDYKLSAPLGVCGSHMVHLYRREGGSVLAPTITQVERPSDGSYLELVKIHGAYFVRQYKTAFSDQVFYFGVPKQKSEERMILAAIRPANTKSGTK